MTSTCIRCGVFFPSQQLPGQWPPPTLCPRCERTEMLPQVAMAPLPQMGPHNVCHQCGKLGEHICVPAIVALVTAEVLQHLPKIVEDALKSAKWVLPSNSAPEEKEKEP